MLLPTSVSLPRVSIIILRGDNSLPVIFAGQTDVHLPHSVQVYASIRFFQVRSVTSLAPKRPASAASGTKDGSSIAFTSLVTDAMFVNSPFLCRLEYQVFGNASKI